MNETASAPVILVVGANSAIAHAWMRLRAPAGAQFVLAGRQADELSEIANDLTVRGASQVTIVSGGIGAPAEVATLWQEAMVFMPRLDIVLLAFGALGNQVVDQQDVRRVREMFDVNLTSVAMWSELSATYFERQGFGHLVLMGSVAGDRGRQSNYIYGAAKSAVERLAQGLAHRFAARNEIHISLVKPGFTITPMTAHIEKRAGPLWATPHRVAVIIDRAVRSGANTAYAPWIWRWIMFIIRTLPNQILHRTKL